MMVVYLTYWWSILTLAHSLPLPLIFIPPHLLSPSYLLLPPGMPYLSGQDTWIDLPRMFGLPLLQPDKIHFRETSDPRWRHVLPLLREVGRCKERGVEG